MHVFSGGTDNVVDFALYRPVFRGEDIVASIGDADDLIHLAERADIKPDAQPPTGIRRHPEAFTPQNGCGFLKVSFPLR